MHFEWDEKKSLMNEDKHGIAFATAISVFADPSCFAFKDTRFTYDEERYVAFGRIESRLFVVVYTLRDDGNIIRIISARKANARERNKYDDYSKKVRS